MADQSGGAVERVQQADPAALLNEAGRKLSELSLAVSKGDLTAHAALATVEPIIDRLGFELKPKKEER